MNLARIALAFLFITIAHSGFSLNNLEANLLATPGTSNGSYSVAVNWNGLIQSPRYVLSERLDGGGWRAVGNDLSSKAFSDKVSGIYDYRLVEMVLMSASTGSVPVYVAESAYVSISVKVATPQGLQASGTGRAGEFTLRWPATIDKNIAQYVINEKREGEASYSWEAQQLVTDTHLPASRTFSAMPAGTHKYRILARRAVGGSNLDSGWSAEFSVSVPVAPTILTSSSSVIDGRYSVNMSSADPSVTHYWLEERVNGGAWSSLGFTTNTTQEIFQTINGSHLYRAYACTPQACSPYSHVSSAVLVNIPDSDGDGWNDAIDAFPADASEWVDSDGDGVGDNGDAFPDDESETADTDADGVGDNADIYPNRPDPGASTVNAALDPENDTLEGEIYFGAVTGEQSVGEDGSFNYRIPIEVPPGINGIQPDLALTYNSNRKNGLVGFGWALSGLSIIQRCNATLLRDGFVAGINPSDLARYGDG